MTQSARIRAGEQVFSLLLQGSRLGFEYPSVHMMNNDSLTGGNISYTPSNTTTRTVKTTTKEFDSKGKVTKETVTEETVTETRGGSHPYYPTTWTSGGSGFISTTNDMKFGQSDTKHSN